MTNLKFFWNGIKGLDGKLQKASYSDGQLLNHPSGTLTIYAGTRGNAGCSRFKADVRQAFAVENDSDSMTDYFESDRIRVTPDHPLYAAVKAAMEARTAHYANRHKKWSA